VICCLVGTVAGYVVAIGLINLLADTHFVWRSFLPLFDGEFIAIYSASLIGGFSVGALASPLFDRTTGATTAAVLLLICIGGMVGALWTPSSELLQSSGRWLSATAIWIAIIYLASAVLLSLLRGSYRAFTRGETLKTGWRFLEALLGTSEVVWWMLAFPMVAFLWFIW